MSGRFSRFLFGTWRPFSLWRLLGSLLFITVASYLGLALYIYVFQSRLVYFPVSTLAGTPADLGLAYRDLRLPTGAAGQSVHAWSVPAAADHDSGRWVLLCHGNGGNISHRLELLKILHNLGFSTLIFDYRGFGESDGRPSEGNTYEDAAAAWRWLTEQQGVEPERIMVFGRSLGGAVAAWLAQRERPGLLVVESSFTSLVDMGRDLYPYLPVGWLARHRYPTRQYVAGFPGPTLVMHSINDEIVPLRMGRELYASAPGDKAFVELRGGHNEVWHAMGREYEDRLRGGIDKLWPWSPAPAEAD